jgi:hypothetical protein
MEDILLGDLGDALVDDVAVGDADAVLDLVQELLLREELLVVVAVCRHTEPLRTSPGPSARAIPIESHLRARCKRRSAQRTKTRSANREAQGERRSAGAYRAAAAWFRDSLRVT